MNPTLVDDLRQHLKLCQEILDLTQQESQALCAPNCPSQFSAYQARKSVLPRLNSSLDILRFHRQAWQQLSIAERAQQPEVMSLIRQNQDLVMRILVLDRENEQSLLRRGLVPARHLPPAARQRPHFVADLYRRNRVGSVNAD
jgi:hypothetical protein